MFPLPAAAALFDDVVTFRFTDATIEVPHLNLRHSWDVYFHFKTTAENGVLMHSKGPTDFVKLVISGRAPPSPASSAVLLCALPGWHDFSGHLLHPR